MGPNYNPDSNCFRNNADPGHPLTSAPSNIDSYDRCGQTYLLTSDSAFTAQVACDSQLLTQCPSGTVANYPRPTKIRLTMPQRQRTMPNPCAGVPANPWCSGEVTHAPICVSGRTIRVPAAMAPRERLIRLTGRVPGFRGAKVSRVGRTIVVHLASELDGVLRVVLHENAKVRHHLESFRFTVVYQGC